MKKALSLLLVLILCLSACASGPSKEDIESKERIERAQNAINALHNLTDKVDYSQFWYKFCHTLYLTETAEIQHNDWTLAYVAAKEAFDALSEKEKQQVKNAEWLTEKSYLIEKYEEILIEQEIVLYCKEVAVEEVKSDLINKSSYEEYGWKIYGEHYVYQESEYDEELGKYVDTGIYSFSVEIKIEYSATNRMGGRIDDVEYVRVRGTYSNGTYTIY